VAVKAQEVALAQIDVRDIAKRIGIRVTADVLDPILRPIVQERAAEQAAPFAPAVTAAVVVPALLVLGIIAALAVRARGGTLGDGLNGLGDIAKGYMAIDQYGQTEHLGLTQHPRKALLDKVGGSSARKIYVDTKAGKTKHVGYIIGGRWFNLYEVKRWEKPA